MSISGLKNTILDIMAEPCTMLTRTIVEDGLGGFHEVYSDGSEFQAAFRKLDSPQERVAEKQGIKETYRLTVAKGLIVREADVIRRESDGKTYRAINNIKDIETPPTSPLDLAAFDAERWNIPHV